MDIDIWEDTKHILSDVKIKNPIIRVILQIGMAPFLIFNLIIWKGFDWLLTKIWGDEDGN